MLPEVDTARELWLPTPEQAVEQKGLDARLRAAKTTSTLETGWNAGECKTQEAQIEITEARFDLKTKALQERRLHRKN